MGRLLTLMVLMVLGALAVRTQDDKPSPYLSHGLSNGLSWRAHSYLEKLAYTDGAMDGFFAGVYTVMPLAGC